MSIAEQPVRRGLTPVRSAALLVALAVGGLGWFAYHSVSPHPEPAAVASVAPPDPLPMSQNETATEGNPSLSNAATASATDSTEPKVLLLSQEQETQIVVVDFFPAREQIAAMPETAAKQYLLRQSLELARKEKPADKNLSKLRIISLFVTNVDEYARGGGFIELAVMETTRRAATDQAGSPEERGGRVEWTEAFAKVHAP